MQTGKFHPLKLNITLLVLKLQISWESVKILLMIRRSSKLQTLHNFRYKINIRFLHYVFKILMMMETIYSKQSYETQKILNPHHPQNVEIAEIKSKNLEFNRHQNIWWVFLALNLIFKHYINKTNVFCFRSFLLSESAKLDMTSLLVRLKQKFGFPLGMVKQFNSFSFRIWLVDNSGSMMFTDGKNDGNNLRTWNKIVFGYQFNYYFWSKLILIPNTNTSKKLIICWTWHLCWFD